LIIVDATSLPIVVQSSGSPLINVRKSSWHAPAFAIQRSPAFEARLSSTALAGIDGAAGRDIEMELDRETRKSAFPPVTVMFPRSTDVADIEIQRS